MLKKLLYKHMLLLTSVMELFAILNEEDFRSICYG